MMIDADFAKFVDDDCDATAVISGQYAIEERGFASPQESCDNNDGRFFRANGVVHERPSRLLMSLSFGRFYISVCGRVTSPAREQAR